MHRPSFHVLLLLAFCYDSDGRHICKTCWSGRIATEWGIGDPEGAALRFDTIYDAAALAYPGDGIGWWGIPDQYTPGFLAERELTAESHKAFSATIKGWDSQITDAQKTYGNTRGVRCWVGLRFVNR